jgi:hypothetical protein
VVLPFYSIALAVIGILAVQYRTIRPSGQCHQLIPIGSGSPHAFHKSRAVAVLLAAPASTLEWT